LLCGIGEIALIRYCAIIGFPYPPFDADIEPLPAEEITRTLDPSKRPGIGLHRIIELELFLRIGDIVPSIGFDLGREYLI
jgi:hypothetical protein